MTWLNIENDFVIQIISFDLSSNEALNETCFMKEQKELTGVSSTL